MKSCRRSWVSLISCAKKNTLETKMKKGCRFFKCQWHPASWKIQLFTAPLGLGQRVRGQAQQPLQLRLQLDHHNAAESTFQLHGSKSLAATVWRTRFFFQPRFRRNIKRNKTWQWRILFFTYVSYVVKIIYIECSPPLWLTEDIGSVGKK